MMWVASKSSPILRAQFQTSLGLRRPVGLTQYIVSGRVRDIATFDDAYSIEAAGQLVRLEPDLSHFIVEYDTEIVRNQWGSVISKRALSDCAVECKQTLAGDFRNVYYVDAPSLYIIYEPVQPGP
jgi:hypothetical protein